MQYASHILMDTTATLSELYNTIGNTIVIQSDDEHMPYRVPIAYRYARSDEDLGSKKIGNRCFFEFEGDMKAYLSKLGTDASDIKIWLQEGADGIDAIKKEGVSPKYVLTAEIEASRGGEIENGLWAGNVREQLSRLLEFPNLAILHGSEEKGYQWKE